MLIFGHRGAAFDAPENTKISILEGLRQGADGVEIDVHLDKDGNFCVIHDSDFERTTGVSAKVYNLTASKIKTFDAGAWKSSKFKGEKVPYLEEILDIVPAGKLIQVELKSSIRAAERLAKVIKASSKKLDEIIVIGFGYDALKRVKENAAKLKIAWINGECSYENKKIQTSQYLINKLKSAKLNAVDFDSRFDIDEKYVKNLNKSGFELYSWTVDNIERAKYFRDIGISAIATNKPRFIREGLERS